MLDADRYGLAALYAAISLAFGYFAMTLVTGLVRR
jgi:hypothetical protein